MTREIVLHNGMIALVDDADFPLVAPFRWRAHLNNHIWYAERSILVRPRSHPEGRKLQLVLMHRVIMAATPDQEIDHVNRNGLDNRRGANLRISTRSQNTANGRIRRPGQYRGVYRAGRKWRAAISGYPGNLEYLGSFDDPAVAATAYDVAAHARFGEFATLNFPAVCQ